MVALGIIFTCQQFYWIWFFEYFLSNIQWWNFFTRFCTVGKIMKSLATSSQLLLSFFFFIYTVYYLFCKELFIFKVAHYYFCFIWSEFLNVRFSLLFKTVFFFRNTYFFQSVAVNRQLLPFLKMMHQILNEFLCNWRIFLNFESRSISFCQIANKFCSNWHDWIELLLENQQNIRFNRQACFQSRQIANS